MSTDFGLIFRRRTTLSESYVDLHANQVEKLKALAEPWAMESSLELRFGPSSPYELHKFMNIRKFNKGGFKAIMSYSPRKQANFGDLSLHDDFLALDLNSRKWSFQQIVETGFLTYVECMSAFTAALSIDATCVVNREAKITAIRDTKRDIDGRDGILIIHPANFWDDMLCQRSYGKSATQVADLLGGKVKHVALVHGGIYFYNFDDWPTPEASLENQSYVESILGRGY
jgi:hypothetical protein